MGSHCHLQPPSAASFHLMFVPTIWLPVLCRSMLRELARANGQSRSLFPRLDSGCISSSSILPVPANFSPNYEFLGVQKKVYLFTKCPSLCHSFQSLAFSTLLRSFLKPQLNSQLLHDGQHLHPALDFGGGFLSHKMSAHFFSNIVLGGVSFSVRVER